MILLEGVRNVVLPCTLALLVPGVVAVLAGRGRATAAGGYVLGAALGVVAAGTVGVDLPSGAPAGVLAGLVVLAGVALAARGRRGGRLGGTLALGVLAAVLWEPCVGPELGTALTAAPAAPVRWALPLVGYALGATLPIPVVAALAQLGTGDDGGGVGRWAATAGAVGGAVLATALATGLYDDAVALLVRATLA